MENNQVKQESKPKGTWGGPRPGGGRKKGVPNKINQGVKEMLLEALEGAGGVEYLITQALKNPNAFMGLIGRILPSEMKNTIEGGITVNVVTNVPEQK